MLKRRSLVLMIVFFVVTLGLYYPIWFLRRRAAFNRLDSPRKLQLWPFLILLAFFVFQLILAITSDPDKAVGEGSVLYIFARLAIGLLVLVQCFIIRDILEDHLARPDDAISSPAFSESIAVSGLMTFFFQILYLQYVINRHIAGFQPQADVS